MVYLDLSIVIGHQAVCCNRQRLSQTRAAGADDFRDEKISSVGIDLSVVDGYLWVHAPAADHKAGVQSFIVSNPKRLCD